MQFQHQINFPISKFPNKNNKTRPLKIIPGIPLCGPDILPDIPPKRNDQINDDRGAHSEQGSVDKILADLAGGDTQPVADSGTNTEGIPFDETFQAVHGSAKLEKSLEVRKSE